MGKNCKMDDKRVFNIIIFLYCYFYNNKPKDLKFSHFTNFSIIHILKFSNPFRTNLEL